MKFETYVLDLRSQEEYNKDTEEQKCPDTNYPFYSSNINHQCRVEPNSTLICDIQDKGNCLTEACIHVNYFTTQTSKKVCDYCISAKYNFTLSCDLEEYNNTDYLLVALDTKYKGKDLIPLGSETIQDIILHE